MKSSCTKDKQTVTSCGDSWIICRSKSYSGRIYYFNTLTGQAIWNLSASEIQKAKQRTASQNGGITENCPEPDEPPKELANMNNNVNNNFNNQKGSDNSPSRIYNKQIINNQFPKQAFPPYTAFIPAQCIPACSTVGGQNNEGIGLNPQAYNPNIWAVAPQLFLTPSVQPVPNQMQQALGISLRESAHAHNYQTQPNNYQTQPNNYQMYGIVQHSSKFGQNQFKRQSRDNRRMNWQQHNRFNNRRNHRTSASSGDPREHRTSSSSVDLRELLRAKKNYNSHHEQNESTDFENGADETNYNSDCDTDWLEENIHVNGSKLTLDVTNLKSLASEDFDPERWYIAVDKNILLRHLNFLNILLNSDESCHLMVSRQVHEQLQNASGSPKIMKRISRAQAFVSQRLEAGTAIIADQLNDIEDDLPHIVNCCLHLQEQYYHVVLLSNDIELQRFKNECSLSIFTIKDLKHFLSQSVNATEDIPENSHKETETTSDMIKITIENDATDLSDDIKSPIRCKSMEQLTTYQAEIDESYENDTAIPQTDTTHNKEEQTEPPPPKQLDDTYKTPAQISKTIDKDKQINSRSKIRLKRSTSNQPSNCSSNDSNRKQFRWRKSRHQSESNKTTTNEVSNQSEQDGCQNYTYVHNESNDSISRENDRSYNDYVEGSECSSVILRNFNDSRVVIEETSTSGIISNSTSNVESDFDTTPLYRSSLSARRSNIQTTNKDVVMFEISDKYMEENLKMRCDEWVSRFVQIMEEVCSQILQQDKTFLPRLMPPPWNMQQAITCIGMKFDSHKEVSDAAKMLLQVLCKISDRDGRISTEPKDYMEMYSYGVHLIEGLKSVIKNNEDIQTAIGLLSNLLNDIQNAELQNNDHFGDQLQEQDPKNCTVDTAEDNARDNDNARDIQATPTKSPQRTSQQTLQHTPQHSTPNSRREGYNLRSAKGSAKDQQQSPQKVQFIRTFDKKFDFLSNFDLQKKIQGPTQNETNTSNSKENSVQYQKSSNEKNEDEPNVISKDSILKKFAINFVKNKNYEQKINNVQTRSNSQIQEKEMLDMDMLDYTEDTDYDEYAHNDYDDSYENDYTALDTCNQTGLGNELANFSDYDNGMDEGSQSQYEDKHEVNSELQKVYSVLFAEIKNVFSFVKRFCVNFQKDSAMLCSNNTQQGTLEKAEKAHFYIRNIMKSLDGMMSRDDEHNKIYKEVAMKTMAQANTLLKAVDVIVDAVKS